MQRNGTRTLPMPSAGGPSAVKICTNAADFIADDILGKPNLAGLAGL
jgi:hypothetical protein